MIDAAEIAMVAGAALAAGAVNAVAGGGSLLSFPALVAVGVPPIAASVTNTVALCPGYLGATLAQRKDLAGQGARIARLVPVAAAGGVAGGALLLATDAAVFDALVPALLVVAVVLVAAQDRLRRWLVARAPGRRLEALAVVPVALAAIYGGYFGAGMGVMILAALGVVLADDLIKINALKQLISLTVNVTAAAFFAATTAVDWTLVGVMAAGALAGGALGGVLARHVPVRVFRALVIVIGLGVAAAYALRL